MLLIEARDRVGGRIWSLSGQVELGAEFVHGRPEATLALLREAGAGVVECECERWESRDGKLERVDDRIGELHRLIDDAARVKPDKSVADFLATVVQRHPELRAAAEWLRRTVEDYDAADPRRASLHAIVEEMESSAPLSSPVSRPRGGYAALVDHMLRVLDPARVELLLGSSVRAVRWSAGAVELQIERYGNLELRRVRALVITLPLGVLQAAPNDPAAVRFDPPLHQKRTALAELAMGSALKILLRFAEPFWKSVDGGRLRNACFFHSARHPFRTFWTTLPERSAWLVAWVGDSRAASLSRESDDIITARAVESVHSLFRGEVDVSGLVEEARLHNWDRDPLARGAYSYVTVGGTGARRRLAEPVDRTLFFAGEATDDTGEASTVAGAISSGERAAAEVNAAL